MNVLRAYCKAKKLMEKFEELSKADLADLLKKRADVKGDNVHYSLIDENDLTKQLQCQCA